MGCIDDKTMFAIIDGDLAGEPRRTAIEHIEGCEKCMNRMRFLVGLQGALEETWAAFRKQECPAPDTLHAYSEGALSAEASAEVKKHLDRCAVCSLIIEQSQQMVDDYIREEQSLLKSNEERLGSSLFGKVRRFIEERFERAEEMLEQADMFRYTLKPVPAFRGEGADEGERRRMPVVCKSGSVIVAVTGAAAEGVRVRLLDEDGREVADESCSSEGMAAFLDVSPGYYTVEIVYE